MSYTYKQGWKDVLHCRIHLFQVHYLQLCIPSVLYHVNSWWWCKI